jgi:hypothetical protein
MGCPAGALAQDPARSHSSVSSEHAGVLAAPRFRCAPADVKASLSRTIPLVIDGTRVIRTAQLLIEREEECAEDI